MQYTTTFTFAPRTTQPSDAASISAAVQPNNHARSPWWTKHQGITIRLTAKEPDPLRQQWRSEPCGHCGALLLESEPLSFCCRNGADLLDPLPPLPPFVNSIEFHPKAGLLSLMLNNAIHFASQGYAGHRIEFAQGVPAVAIQGTIYQRLFPADKERSPLNMFLFNPAHQDALRYADMPRHWIPALRRELQLFNPILAIFEMLTNVEATATAATLELKQQGPSAELAGIIHYGSIARKDPRSIYVHKLDTQGPARIGTDHPLYDALSYPLLFPHGTAQNTSTRFTLRKIVRILLLTERRFRTL
ncbi:unnamed protein product [Tilletia controversa]|nr:unnamed protein product [Tilletia controversa]